MLLAEVMLIRGIKPFSSLPRNGPLSSEETLERGRYSLPADKLTNSSTIIETFGRVVYDDIILHLEIASPRLASYVSDYLARPVLSASAAAVA